MGKRGSALAWAVAVLAAIGLVASLAWGFGMRQRVHELTQQVAAAESQGLAVKHQAEQQDEQVRRLEDTVAKLEKRVTPGAGPDAVPAGEPEAAATTDRPETDAPAPKEDEEGGMGQMMKMFEGEQGRKFAEMSADAAIPMYYSDLFEQLALPADAEEKVRKILRDHMVRQIRASADFMKGGGEGKDGTKMKEEMDAALRKDLSEVLNDTGLAIYDDYQEGFQDRVLRQSYEMQLGMFAPGLTEENRAMAVDVMVEEMSDIANAGNNMDMSPGAINAALEALERSRERLSTVFDEQQLAQVDRFIQQQRAGIEIFQQMMSGQEKPAAPAAPEPQEPQEQGQTQ